ncbi:hypothetical protein DID88_006372 [Monilinia fructigena]|uniref:Uncharacterized protein n=1 Tax=Monilinia fructigena TaxID=38457 RepID=A0A395J2H9_9HELO|nr:hypothetical protein DID88_006372 [Monilinia fructigena]
MSTTTRNYYVFDIRFYTGFTPPKHYQHGISNYAAIVQYLFEIMSHATHGFSSSFPSLLIEPTRGGSLSHVLGSSLKDIVLDNSQDHASFKVFFMNHRYPALQSTMIESSYSSTLT